MNSVIKVKSLQKALEILNCFIDKQPLGVTEISDKLGLYKSNVHNILTTFAAMEYLTQDEETGKFQLGPRVLQLSHTAVGSFDIVKIVKPYLDALAEQFNETAYLAIPSRREVIYLGAAYPGRHRILAQYVQGDSAPMHATSVGKAMLAALPDAFLEQYIREPLVSFTENTITDPEALRREIEKTKQRGYALDNMELSTGLICVGVALSDLSGNIRGALSISGPLARFDKEKIEEMQKALKQCATELKRKL